MAIKPTAAEKKLEKNIEFGDKFVYNKEDDIYVSYLTGATKAICIKGDTHRAMQRAYCGEDERGVDEICAAHEFPVYLFKEYARLFGWTRDGMILTDEEIGEATVEQSAEAILAHRRFEVNQEVQKRKWKATEKEAQSWREFQLGYLDPFEEALNRWTPPKRTSRKAKPKPAAKDKSWFVIGFSDLQIGAESVERYMFRQEEWNTEKACAAMDRLVDKILVDLKKFTFNFEGAVLLLAGDLFHGLKGKTEKGTELECDLLRDDQCEAVMNILTHAIERLSEAFPKLVVHSVRGNHDGTDHYPIIKGVANYFRKDEKIEFNVYSSRTAAFKIQNTFVLLDHGASDLYNSDVPKAGKPRESYIQSLLLSPKIHPMLAGANQRLFIQGDKHHYEQIEYGDFEFIMLGALPLGDQYADNNNLNSRARQNCFIIDSTGLKCSLHYYVS